MKKIRIRARRNVSQSIQDCMCKLMTVNSDSSMSNAPGTTLLRLMKADCNSGDIVLSFDVRDRWTIQTDDGLSFAVHQSGSHKYWLRNLIRRCR